MYVSSSLMATTDRWWVLRDRPSAHSRCTDGRFALSMQSPGGVDRSTACRTGMCLNQSVRASPFFSKCWRKNSKKENAAQQHGLQMANDQPWQASVCAQGQCRYAHQRPAGWVRPPHTQIPPVDTGIQQPNKSSHKIFSHSNQNFETSVVLFGVAQKGVQHAACSGQGLWCGGASIL